MYISSKFKCQLSFNWHLNLIEVCATQSRYSIVLSVNNHMVELEHRFYNTEIDQKLRLTLGTVQIQQTYIDFSPYKVFNPGIRFTQIA